MELPKALVLADVALQVFHVSFDLFSPKCSTFNPPVITTATTSTEKNEVEPHAVVSEDGVQEEKSQEDPGDGGSRTARLSETDLELTESKEEVPSEALDKDNLENDHENKDEVWDDLDENVVDLRAFSVAGPIIYFQLFQLPPQPKLCNGWTIQQALLSGLQSYHLTIQSAEVKESASSSSPTGSEGEGSNVAGQKTKSQLEIDIKNTSDPIRVKMSLPKSVAFFEAPTVARWDETESHWFLDGFEEFSYNEDEMTVEFRICQFGPMAIFQDLYINMPFQCWELLPKGENHCVFNLSAAMVELEIEIKDGQCRLVSIAETDCLDSVVGTWMSVVKLVEVCKSHGVNVFPNVDGKRYVAITDKEHALVDSIYHCMALVASSFAMQWSKWSAECASDAVVLQACSAVEGPTPNEKDYGLFMTTTRISSELALKENDVAFSPDMKEGRQMHPNLFHMLRDGASSLCCERIESNSSLFIDAVHRLLVGTNPIVYS